MRNLFSLSIHAYKIFFLIFSLIISLSLLAKNRADSVVNESNYGMVRTNISVQYDHTWGQVTDGFVARVSYQFLKKRHLSLTGNFKYNSVTIGFQNSDLNEDFSPDEIGLNGVQTMEQIGLTTTFNTKLFGKPLICLGILNSEWGEGGFNRVSVIIMATIMLRSNQSTQFGLGVMGMINTTSKLPVLPVFFYRHRFDDKWMLNLYGGMFYLDFTPSKNNLFAIGADIDSKSFYFKPVAKSLPKTCRYTQTNFRPMIKYRRQLIKNLYFEAQSGYVLNMSSRVNGVNGTTEYIKISQKPHPFVQFSPDFDTFL